MENIQPEKVTEFSDELSNLLRDVYHLEVGQCIQCGTCCGGCPSGRRTAMRTREILRKAQLGLDEVLEEKELWFCSTCYTCTERCIRNVPATDIIIALRNLAVERGHIQAPHLALCKMLYNTGHGVPINDEKWNKLRESYELDGVPPTTHKYPKAEEEVKILLESTQFDKLVGVGKYEKKPDAANVNDGG
jgi:heterodisulfide reductase subunit C